MVEKSQDMKKNHAEGTVCDETLKGREVTRSKEGSGAGEAQPGTERGRRGR